MPETSFNPSERDRIEHALALALAAHETGGAPALEQFLAEHADDAPRLREALADLQGIDLLQATSPDLPVQLGEFRIKQQLGAGGMGVVYLAEQSSLGREVALKVVRPELLFFDGARERFRREIEAVARLEHPAIVPILATGSADGIPYYAMPRIRGRSAEAVVKEHAARDPTKLTGGDLRDALGEGAATGSSDGEGAFAGTWSQSVVRLVRQAALGIEHAHSRGILHRDLKPSNLMLTADGRAIVLDFGLAQARGDARLTRTGSAAGSPAYMAPEQVHGEPADERTDVYGLAATMHCLLVLRPPFDAADPEALRAQILAGVRQDPRRRATVPTELRLVLECAMDVERKRRYASASAFADDLQAVLDGRPILARGLPVAVRLRRFAARRRALATAAAALALFVIVLPSVLLWQQQKANAVLSEQVERSDRSVKVSVDAVEKLLANTASNRIRNLPAMQEVASQMLRDALDLFDQLAEDETQGGRIDTLRIHALQRLCGMESSLGRPAPAIAAARRALALLGKDTLNPIGLYQRARVRRQLASLMLEENRLDEVRMFLELASADVLVLAADPSMLNQTSLETGLCEGLRARLAMAAGDAVSTERALRAAVDAMAVSAHLDPAMYGIARVNLLRFLKERGQYEEGLQLAEALLAEPLDASIPELGWPVPRMISAMAQHERAAMLQRSKRTEEAIAAATQAMAMFDALVRDYPEEPSVRRLRGGTANNLAQIHTARRDWAAARGLLEAACGDQMAVLARNAKDSEALLFLGNHRRSLCVCLFELGDFEALRAAARVTGRMASSPMLTFVAAVSLLRCAVGADAADKASLQVESLDLLAETVHRGRAIDLDDPLLAALRDDPRFVEIASRNPGR